jgi:hypothetical protein
LQYFLARYANDLTLGIACGRACFPGFRCDLRFPFAGFSVEQTSNEANLPKWREIIDRGKAFLGSKQYNPQ